MRQSEQQITTLLIEGSNKQGQLGITQQQTELKEHNYGVRILNIACGGYFTLMLLETQQCCLLGFNITKMIDIPKVEYIACGQWHMIIRTNNGIYVWGNNDDGQLGLGDYEPRNEPELLDIQFGNIVCGSYHTLIYQSDFLYTFGRGNKGQLLINKDKSCVPIKIEYQNIKFIAAGDFQTFIYSNQLNLNGKVLHYNGIIKQLACNNDYSAIVTIDGIAIFWDKSNTIKYHFSNIDQLSMFGSRCYLLKKDGSVELLDGTIITKQIIKSIHTGEQHSLFILQQNSFDSIVNETLLLSGHRDLQSQQQENRNYLFYEKKIAELQLSLAKKDKQILQLQNEINALKNNFNIQ
ncbi:unnamed protein product [Paramecium pentaurelia]|uniref:Uncharacterized protein n=1 Tax=Paramecium pentaurelia TaxID=43138 RepID=A0A8S1VRK0_9CILI|nr:unnamed protein product [Paramecium pentaurelia]